LIAGEECRDSLNSADSAGETAMMGIQETPARLFYDFCLEEHVPVDHVLRGLTAISPSMTSANC
jgi:hypothetical protein